MFTGIIKAQGRITSMTEKSGDMRLLVTAADLPWMEFEVGESIAVNGVCLTAVSFTDKGFETDVSTETLNVTALKSLKPGSKVNLEPAVSLGERLGGHLVSGHIDCIGVVKKRADDARSVRLAIEIPAEYTRYVAKKGSICIDGVSLTINAVSGNVVEVNIIPHTAEKTIIDEYQVGTEVNIEVDLVARYLERLVMNDDGEISLEFLKENGYA